METPPEHSLLLGISIAESDPKALVLADELEIPLLTTSPSELTPGYFVCVLDQQGLALHHTGKAVPGPIRVDFISGAAAHRRLYGGGKSQLIAKAAGLKSAFKPRVLDLTAGLGQDGFVLATLGCSLVLVERTAIIYQLLADGWRRALVAEDPTLAAIAGRMSVINQDSLAYLQTLTEAVDIIYLDPMFPERSKKAKVKKTMAAFQRIVGSDEDAGELLAMALTKAKYRVIVKRPRKAPGLDQQYPQLRLPAPGLVLSGQSSRFDIYPLHKMPD